MKVCKKISPCPLKGIKKTSEAKWLTEGHSMLLLVMPCPKPLVRHECPLRIRPGSTPVRRLLKTYGMDQQQYVEKKIVHPVLSQRYQKFNQYLNNLYGPITQ